MPDSLPIRRSGTCAEHRKEGIVARNPSLLLGCSLMFVGVVSQAPTSTGLTPKPTKDVADRVWLTGTSTFSNFTCVSERVYVSAEAAPEEFVRTKEDGVPAVRKAAVSLPVRSLDCGLGLRNADMFKALDATANPNISFTLDTYTIEQLANARHVRLTGALRIAGAERNVVFNATIFRDAAGEWNLRGERAINMGDFGVTSPRRFLGLLRVRDEVVVHFQVQVRPLIDPLGVLATALH